MTKKTFELTFVIRYEVTEDMLPLEYDLRDGQDWPDALDIDIEQGKLYPGEYLDDSLRLGTPVTVTGRIVEDSK